MERLTIAANFQKSIELLKNTECSQKEKLSLFAQIADCIESPALRGNTNYLSYVSNAVTILLMFCEELDSVTRISAEENLNRIVRFSTPSHIVRIQYDLFHEIKKNGNDRSLRIALNLFGHYCHLIKQRKIKPYAINLMPCILSIAKRREQQLIETLSEFIVQFCEHLQICLNENEVLKLMEAFSCDAIKSECAVKRRCAAANAIRFVEHSRRPDVMAKYALTTCLDTLVKEYTPNNIVGALGLLRLLLPVVLRLTNGDQIVIAKTIEIVEFCLHLLHDPSHTIINAALECLNVIFDNPRPRLKHFLCSFQLRHMEILRKRRTLKHQIFKTKSSTSSIEFGRSKNNLFSASFTSSPVHVNQSTIENESGHETSVGGKRMNATGDEKALLTCSDIEMESFKYTDFDTSRGDADRGYDSSATHSPAIASAQRKMSASGDSVSLKSQSDSIGSFFTSILAHPNTESVSKFFRGGTDTSAQPTTPKGSQNDSDNISVISMGSQISINSHNSSSFDLLQRTDESSLPEIEILTDQDIDAIQIECLENSAAAETTTLTGAGDDNYRFNERVLFIGHIANQPIVHYTVRLIAMKFLLAGTPNELIDDKLIRVSIKNLSLVAIAHCVALWPSVLSLTMEKCDDLDGGIDAPKSYQSSDDGDDSSTDTIDNEATSQNVSSVTADAENDAGDQLVIKDDHFGQSDAMTSSYFDFMLPLSKSADHVLLTQLNSTQAEANRSRNERLNTNLSELLSKSDIVPSTSRSAENSSFRAESAFPAMPSTKTAISSVTKYTIDRCCGVDIELQRDANAEPLQCIEDVLLYANHSDPILRADIQLIAGHYLAAMLNDASLPTASSSRFLRGEILTSLLLHALKDDIHVVVKQSLNAVKLVLPALMRLHDITVIFDSKNDFDEARKILPLDELASSHQFIERILDKISFVHNNKYWVVQNSYADFIAKLDFEGLRSATNADVADEYREQFMSHIYAMLGDNDQRVRNAAADALSELMEGYKITTNEINRYGDHILLSELIEERIFADLPSPLCNLLSDELRSNQIDAVLGKCLFHLSNLLLLIECKQRQFGVIKSIVQLLKAYNPITYHHIWNEFNFVEVSLSLMMQNYATGTDLICHGDLITISTQLLVARLSAVERDAADRKLCLSLVDHNLKLANIFHHIFSGQKPLFIPKGQKNDIFMNAKELQALNSRGYFGNNYFYLKIYKMIKLMHENFKITITADIDANLLALLRTCLQSLSVLLEVLDPLGESGATLKLIEETLVYLTTFLQHVPIETVQCTKHLLKYMFSMNFACCRENYGWFLRNKDSELAVADEVFEHLRNFNEFIGIETFDVQAMTPVPPSPLRSGQKLLSFASANSSSASDDHVIGNGKIKLFEPIVIQCLKLFTKSNCEIQAVILDMICQVLELRVSYCLLDSNSIFIEFIFKLLEMIETGTVKNSHVVIPHIIKFLFYLSKQKEQTLITIPKIINVTDTLLANSVTQNGYIEALRELAYEFYVRQSIGDADANDLTPTAAKELNTQKEVAFSMLLKFIENPMIQKVICTVLLKEGKKSQEMHAELAGYLLQILTDHKCILNEMEAYRLFSRLIQSVHDNIGGENMVEILLKKSKMTSFHDMVVQTLIVNSIAANRTEGAFTTDIASVIEKLALGAAAYANDLICKHFHRQISSGFDLCEEEQENESKMVFRTLEEQRKMIGILKHFLVGVANLLSKFGELSLEFDQNVKAKDELVERAIASVRISSLNCTADAKLKIFDVILATVIARNSENDRVMLAAQLKKLNDANKSNGISAKIRIHLTRVLLKLPMGADDVENLLRTNFDELMACEQGRQCILSSNENSMLSTKIVEKLQSFIRTKVLDLETLGFTLDVIADCNEIALPFAINLLLDEFLLHSNQNPFHRSILMKRTFSVFDQLLKRLVGDHDQPDMETFENAITVDMVDRVTRLKEKYAKSELFKLCAGNVTKILNIYENNDEVSSTDESALSNVTIVAPVDEQWLLQQAEYVAFTSNSTCVYRVLSEIRNESKLHQIFESPRFDRRMLTVIIEQSFDDMIKRFKHDCFQHNPHMNYLKIPLVLRLAIDALVNEIESICSRPLEDDTNIDEVLANAATALTTFLRCIERSECECLVYVEAQFVERFIGKHLLRHTDFDAFVRFVCVCLNHVDGILKNHTNDLDRVNDVRNLCECINVVLQERHIVAEINNNLAKYETLTNALVPTVYEVLKRFLASATFMQTYGLEHLMEYQRRRQRCEDTQTEMKYAMAIFIGKFVECCYAVGDGESSTKLTSNVHHLVKFKNLLFSLAISALRIDVYYFFAVTPYEVLQNFDWDLSTHRQTNRLPSLPIDHLNDVEIVEKFVRRINIFGFLARTNFEEFFMSLLLLINKPTDFDVVDAQEQYQIKSICLTAIVELLLSCKMFATVGRRDTGQFHHIPRLPRPTADSIGLKKLYKLQSLFESGPSIFYMPNLERNLTGFNGHKYRSSDHIIGSNTFAPNQCELNVIWHIIEEQSFASHELNVSLKNMRYFLENSNVDMNSSVQVIFDVFTQLIEENCALVLPQLTKFCEICENREQFRWIKNAMTKLHESVHIENAVCHKHIIYCLCKSYSILIPSTSELNQLCTQINGYLKSNHLFVRTAALKGLLCLLESAAKSNTTIGGLSEEILILRTLIISYIKPHGIVEESSMSFSDEHTILVWTLNFYLIEITTKFVPDCSLLANSIISANNILKRTTVLEQYLCILHGLERLVIMNVTPKYLREKIEKVALDLVKLENETFSLAALKLLVTCMYMDCAEQLKKTELSNGIVQDEPEVIVHSTEKIDILFNRIKVSTTEAAHIYGSVLCQLTYDLVPPNELLTKVIKELLTISQPHCEVIAKVLFQVFRSAIDSSYLPVLQEWLVYSLPNFLLFPIDKTIWCLTVIFISASINLTLIKIFPEVLAKYDDLVDETTPTTQLMSDTVAGRRRLQLFALACKDFHSRLGADQKNKFRILISNHESPEIQFMLNLL